MMEGLDNTNDPVLEGCLEAMRAHGENLRRQQRLNDSIDRIAAAGEPVRRRPQFLYYTLGGVAACLALFLLISRFSNGTQNLQQMPEVAQLQEMPSMPEPSPAEGAVAGVETAGTRAMPAVTETVEKEEEKPEDGNFAISVTPSHPQLASHEPVVTDAVPADRTEKAGTVEAALPLPADSLPMANPAAEIYTLHTLVSYSQPVRERRLRLPFRRFAEQSREYSPVTSLLTINFQTTNH